MNDLRTDLASQLRRALSASPATVTLCVPRALGPRGLVADALSAHPARRVLVVARRLIDLHHWAERLYSGPLPVVFRERGDGLQAGGVLLSSAARADEALETGSFDVVVVDELGGSFRLETPHGATILRVLPPGAKSPGDTVEVSATREQAVAAGRVIAARVHHLPGDGVAAVVTAMADLAIAPQGTVWLASSPAHARQLTDALPVLWPTASVARAFDDDETRAIPAFLRGDMDIAVTTSSHLDLLASPRVRAVVATGPVTRPALLEHLLDVGSFPDPAGGKTTFDLLLCGPLPRPRGARAPR